MAQAKRHADSNVSNGEGSSVVDLRSADPKDARATVGTGTLGKAMEVLDIIALAEKPLRFTDVLKQVDQPRGTLHRQISNLVGEGLVMVNSDSSYSVGTRLLKLAARAWSQNSLRSAAEPHIRALHEATGETVHLGQMNGLEVIYLDKIESNQTVRMHSQVGNASPLYCTGIGKAMMAELSEGQAAELATQFNFIQHTPTTHASAKKILSELKDIRAKGISHDREEHEPGIYCVAAAIVPDREQASAGMIGGISVTSPAYRLDKKIIKNWEKLVAETAKAIESDVATLLGPRHQTEFIGRKLWPELN